MRRWVSDGDMDSGTQEKVILVMEGIGVGKERKQRQVDIYLLCPANEKAEGLKRERPRLFGWQDILLC